MSRRRSPLPPDDDGWVIADMNVEGMPGYRPGRRDGNASSLPPPTKKETRALMASTLVGALLIAGIFFGAFALLILFMTQVWFG